MGRRDKQVKSGVWALGLALALSGCPQDPSKHPQAPLPKATPLLVPLVALLPEAQIRDVTATPTATWVATGGALLRFGASGEPARFGPPEGLEFGEATRLVSDGESVGVAGRRGVYLYQDGALRRVPLPSDPLLQGYQPRDLALRDGELWAIFGPQVETLPLLCGEKPMLGVALSKVFRLTSSGAESISTPAPPQAIAASPEGLWVASGNKLYVLENGFSQFREMALDKGADIYRLQVDPGGRIWALTDQGLFGGTAKKGVEAIDGGQFFAGPREALGLGFVGDILWVATTRGVYRFDGKVWSRFELPRSAEATVTAIAAQKDTLFIGSDHGLIAGNESKWSVLLDQDPAPEGAVRAITKALGKILIGTASEPGFALNAGGLQSAITDQKTEALLDSTKPLDTIGTAPKLSRPGQDPTGSSPRAATLQPISVTLSAHQPVGLFALGQDGALFPVDDGGLSSGVLALQQGRDGTLWIAGRRGVRQVGLNGKASAPDEMKMIGARSITIDKRGAVWFAAIDAPTGRGLGLYGRVIASWISLTTQDGLSSNEVYAVAAQEGTLYAAQDKGVTLASEAGLNTTKLPSTIFDLEVSGQEIWAAGCDQLFHREQDTWANYPNLPNGVALAMVFDSKGRLFAGNRSGLYQFQEGTSGAGSRWLYVPGAGGVGVSALQIIPDADGKEVLWIGAESGAVLAISLPE